MLNEASINILLMTMCYLYILIVIFVSSKINKFLPISRKTSRKFLQIMIGNLAFILPFFTFRYYPVLVAAPFIPVTFLTSPFSPFKNLGKALRGLGEITEEGHPLGLVFYALSYTFLALFFASKPLVIAAGVLPMAYGDSAAARIGERYGRIRYRFFAEKSLEGSTAMFLASFLSFMTSLIFFSSLSSSSVSRQILSAFMVAVVATLAESLSSKGLDNVIVPILSALTFLMIDGGF